MGRILNDLDLLSKNKDIPEISFISERERLVFTASLIGFEKPHVIQHSPDLAIGEIIAQFLLYRCH